MPFVTGNRTEYKYIYELPYTERKCLCNILDINDQWERLGGEKMGFSVLELSEMRRAERCGDSPTDRLLQHWGRKNNTILNLYCLLYSMEHFQAMSVLLPFVPKEYHYERLHEDLVMKSNSTPKSEEVSERVTAPQALPKPDPKLLVDLRNRNGNTERASGTRSELINRSSHNAELVGPFPTGAKSKVPQHYLRETVNDKSESSQAAKILNTDITLGRQEYEEYKSIEDNLQVNHSKATPKKVVEENFKPTKVSRKEEEAAAAQAQAQATPQATPSRKRYQSNCSDVSNLSDCGVPMISYKELEEATSSWSINQKLGSGGFGSVYKGTWINVNVAIKRIDQCQKELPNASSMHMSQVLDELRFLQKYRHDNILQVYGFSADADKPHCLVYQFMSNGSLEYRLQCKKIEAFSESTPSALTWSQRFNIAKGTAAALQFLHTVQEKPLIHGDVKSANILLDGYLQPKLGDFGLAREGPHSEYTSMKVSHVHGTRPYIPDEYLRSKKLSTKVDTYSFGIVLFEICSGKRAYNERNKKYLKEEVLENSDRYTLRDTKAGHDAFNVFDTLFDFGMGCIHRIPKKRPDMTTVFQNLESFGKILKEEERNRKISIEEFSHVISSQTPPLTYTSISTSPSIYPHYPSMHAPHPFMHPHQMISPHLRSFSPSSQLPYRNHPGVPGINSISPVSHGIPPWMKGVPIPQQEIITLSPEPGRPSQGFCPSPQPSPLQKGREENDQTAPPQIPMIPDISRLILQSSSELPVGQNTSDNSSECSTSPSSEEESELQMDMSGSHESLSAGNNAAAASPKDSNKESNKVPTEVCIPLLAQLGTATRPPAAGNNSNRQSQKEKKAVSAQGKSTFLD